MISLGHAVHFMNTVRPQTERFLGQKIPRSAQNTGIPHLVRIFGPQGTVL